jgi:GNAT superfamily N-acetyltransferase
MQKESYFVEPKLLWAWLSARSLVRGLPQPVPDRGAMRVDTGSPSELRRFVFSGPEPGIRELAESITAPRIYIKACGSADQLRALVPPGWQLQPSGYLMIHDGVQDKVPALNGGYRLEIAIESSTRFARIFADDGSVAASGYAVEHGGVFVFDRIATAAAHRRRGLGKALMSALGATQQSPTARRVLVATEDGRALYSTLGWTVLSPYSTVVIND